MIGSTLLLCDPQCNMELAGFRVLALKLSFLDWVFGLKRNTKDCSHRLGAA